MTLRPISFVVVFAAALALAGCQTESRRVAGGSKHLRPVPAKTVALIEEKGMKRSAPILVRIYKEESELEVWKKNQEGQYAHLKTYEICRWSGTLGPKKKEGDKQAPEGFYAVTPGQLNPRSGYYLSFDLGYPNSFDRAHGRSGSHLMVHGDCLSKGCYAMTDEQIAEVYALAREAFNGGQKSFQVQAMPFRMTADNMARRRDDKNFAFWKNLKEGADHFEVTKQEPRIAVCDRKYVFNADAPEGARFEPSAGCPQYQVEPGVALAVAGKRQKDDQRFAELVEDNYELAAAYVPQNGRIRRSLSDPIATPAPVVMTAQAPRPAASSGIALAMASGVPTPVPSPYAAAAPAKSEPSFGIGIGKVGSMFAWVRGGESAPAAKPVPADLIAPSTPSRAAPAPTTPRAPVMTASVQQRPRPAPVEVAAQRPVAASMVPSAPQPAAPPPPAADAESTKLAAMGGAAKDKFKKLFDSSFNFTAKPEEPAPQPASTTPAAPVPVPAPPPGPQASAPAQRDALLAAAPAQ